MKTKKSFLILLGGYISIIGFYFMWYYAKYNFLFFSRSYLKYSLAENAVVVFGITFLFFFVFLLISFIRPLKKPWPCFSLVSIITLSTLLLIPSNYYAKYHENYFNWVKQKRFERVKNKRRRKENLKKEMETKLNNPIVTNDAANRTIAKPQARLKTENGENDKLRKQLKEVIRESRSKDETISALRSKFKQEHETKGDVVVQAKSNKDFSKIKIDSEVGHTESDTKNQEIKASSSKKIIVKSITYKIEKDRDKVFIALNNFSTPKVFTIESDKPRIVIDIKNVSSWSGNYRTPVNGNLIKQVRTHLHRDIEKLRIVLDINPSENFSMNQIYYKTKNIYCIEVR